MNTRLGLSALGLAALALSGCASSRSWNSEAPPPAPLRELAAATRTRIIEVPITPNTQHWVSAPSEDHFYSQADAIELPPEELDSWFDQFRPYADFTAYSQNGELVRATAWVDSDDPKSVDALLNWGARQLGRWNSAGTVAWMRSTLEGEGHGVTEGPAGRLAVKRSTDPNFYFVEVQATEPVPPTQIRATPPAIEEIEELRASLGFDDFERPNLSEAEGEYSRWRIRNGEESIEVHWHTGTVRAVLIRLTEPEPEAIDRLVTHLARWCAADRASEAQRWIRGALAAKGMLHGRAFREGIVSAGAFARNQNSPPAYYRFDAMFPTEPRAVEELWENGLAIEEDDD